VNSGKNTVKNFLSLLDEEASNDQDAEAGIRFFSRWFQSNLPKKLPDQTVSQDRSTETTVENPLFHIKYVVTLIRI
jgi:hypothetical protein